MRTAGQDRAKDALDRVTELSKKSDGFKKRYRAYVDRLCQAIVMNGLGQALATELAAAGADPRKEDQQAHKEVYVSLERWLCRAAGGIYPSKANLLQAMMSENESHYLRAQAEALAWLDWHKKFCRATFPQGEEE